MRCPNCETELATNHQRFCQDCGQRVRDRDTTGSLKRPAWANQSSTSQTEMRKQAEAAEENLAGSRRAITVLFVDIQGFTSFCENRDPEEVIDLINQYFGCFSEIVYRHKGYVDKYMGDALMALFGAPIAYGQDPQNAARAALEILDALKNLNQKTGFDLKIRMGLNLGPIVMGGVGAGQKVQFTVLGDAVNVAQRLQSIAESNEIITGPEFAAAVYQEFQCEKKSVQKLKGREEVVQSYRLVGLAQRLQSNRFVGRSNEINLIKSGLEALNEGKGFNLRLTGPAGIGKTALKNQIKAQFMENGGLWIEPRLDASGRPLQTIKDIVTRTLGSRLSVDPQTKDLRILHLKPWNLSASIRVNLENLLMRSEFREDVASQKHNWFSSLVEFFMAIRRGQKIGFYFDGFDQMDSLSQEFVHFLARENTSLFLGMTSNAAVLLGPFTTIEVPPLNPQEILDLAASLLDAQSLPSELQAMILKKTQGNPYFVKEFISYLKQREIISQKGPRVELLKPLDSQSLPETLQSLLLSKVDKLYPGDREVLEVAAVAGDRFSDRLIQRCLKGKDQVRESLQFLIQSNFLQIEKVAGTEAIQYAFCDKLIQEVLLSALLEKRKTQIHLALSSAAEFLNQQGLWNESRMAEEVIARHLFDAGETTSKALEYARAWRDRSTHHGRWSSVVDASTYVLQILKAKGQHSDLLRESLLLGDAWIQMGNRAKAKDAFAKIASQSRKEANQELELLSLSRLLDIARTERNLEAGNVVLAEIEKSLLVEIPESSGFCIYKSLGNWYRFRGALKDALQSFNRALKLCDPSQSHLLAELLNDLGIVFAMLHDSQASIQCFDEGIRAADRPWLRLKLKMNRANQKMLLGQNELALEEFQNLQKEAETLGDWTCLSRVLYHQVLCQIRLGEPEGLKAPLSRAMDLFRRLQYESEYRVCSVLIRELELNPSLNTQRLNEILKAQV